MANANHQDILNIIYTQKNARDLFMINRDQFYADFRIENPKLIHFLNEIENEQLLFFANSLMAKRKHAVHSLLPITAHLLEHEFTKHFNNFSQKYVPKGVHKHHDDAIEFCLFLIKEKKYIFSKIQLDLIEFEKDCVSNFITPLKFKLKLLKTNPVKFLMKLKPGAIPSKDIVTVLLWMNGNYKIIVSF